MYLLNLCFLANVVCTMHVPAPMHRYVLLSLLHSLFCCLGVDSFLPCCSVYPRLALACFICSAFLNSFFTGQLCDGLLLQQRHVLLLLGHKSNYSKCVCVVSLLGLPCFVLPVLSDNHVHGLKMLTTALRVFCVYFCTYAHGDIDLLGRVQTCISRSLLQDSCCVQHASDERSMLRKLPNQSSETSLATQATCALEVKSCTVWSAGVAVCRCNLSPSAAHGFC